MPKLNRRPIARRTGIAVCCVLFTAAVAPATVSAAEDDCTAVLAALNQSGSVESGIASARSKLEATPVCGYLVADAARNSLPAGPERTRAVDEALEASRDWAPTTGPLAIGYLKAAILAANDPTLDLPKWRERLPLNMITLRNLASPGEMRQVDDAIEKPYRPMLEHPFNIENCNALAVSIPANIRLKLAAACDARTKLLAACAPLGQPESLAAAAAADTCEADMIQMAQRYPQDANHPAMADLAGWITKARAAHRPPAPQPQPQPQPAPPVARAPAHSEAPVPPRPQKPGVMKRVKSNVSLGYLNMRSGPGTNFGVVTQIPAGAGGVRLTSKCKRPSDGTSKHAFCLVEWGGKLGWVSINGLQ